MKMQIIGDFFNDWVQIGPAWKTEVVFRVREVLRSEQIDFRMPSSDIFYMCVLHHSAEDRRWSVLVRRREWEKAVTILAREGLTSRVILQKSQRDQKKLFQPASRLSLAVGRFSFYPGGGDDRENQFGNGTADASGSDS